LGVELFFFIFLFLSRGSVLGSIGQAEKIDIHFTARHQLHRFTTALISLACVAGVRQGWRRGDENRFSHSRSGLISVINS